MHTASTRHLSCWAGQINATLALLRASSVRDLYLPDYDVRGDHLTAMVLLSCVRRL
jgi:hypothetical protein